MWSTLRGVTALCSSALGTSMATFIMTIFGVIGGQHTEVWLQVRAKMVIQIVVINLARTDEYSYSHLSLPDWWPLFEWPFSLSLVISAESYDCICPEQKMSYEQYQAWMSSYQKSCRLKTTGICSDSQINTQGFQCRFLVRLLGDVLHEPRQTYKGIQVYTFVCWSSNLIKCSSGHRLEYP